MNPFLNGGERRARRSWGQRLVLVFNLLLISSCLLIAGALSYAGDRASAINRVALDRSLTEVDEVESGARVLNILLVGSDSSAALDPDDPIQVGRQGERFGDVIIVAHIDERGGNVALLSLPRDLWVDIAGTQREDRINRAFLVGGPATLIDTIEENFGIPIHHYVNVDFAGFQGLVEAVGSVDVYFETPARDWNVNAEPEPRSQTGFVVETAGCHSLDPEDALAYVRSRYYQTQDAEGRWVTDPTSDLGRIDRQQDFLQRLLQEAIDAGARNPLVLGNLIDAGIQNVAIDQELTPAMLVELSATYRSFEPGDLQTYTYPAVDGTVGNNQVLIPRHEDAEALVTLFGGEPFDSPESVAVELLYDELVAEERTGPTVVPDAVAPVVDQLTIHGFEYRSGGGAEADVEPGLTVRHGPDGAQAAALVVEALSRPGPLEPIEIRVVQVPYLSGRNIVVAVGDQLIEGEPGAVETDEAPAEGPMALLDLGLTTTTESPAPDAVAPETTEGDGIVADGSDEQPPAGPETQGGEASPTEGGEAALAASAPESPVAGCR